MTKATVKKIAKIIGSVVIYLFFFLCIFLLIVSVTGKKDSDGATNIFGKQIRIVVSDSMAKCDQTDVSAYEIEDIPVKSMIFIDLVPEDEGEANAWYAKLKEGDVLTFRYKYIKQETITHRITKITEKETGGYIIELEGDNKSSDTDTLTQTIDTSVSTSPNYVIGKVTGQSYFLGVLVTAVKSPVGLVCIVIIPSLAIAILEVVRLVGMSGEKRKQKRKEKEEAQERELEELKRRLDELLKGQKATPAQTEEQAEESPESKAEETQETPNSEVEE